jgi:hypothetical protein
MLVHERARCVERVLATREAVSDVSEGDLGGDVVALVALTQ